MGPFKSPVLRNSLLASAALVAWACAQANEPAVGDDDDSQTRGGTGGRGGSSAQGGKGGSSAQTGGASGQLGTGGTSATGGTTATGGTSATGGTGGVAGSLGVSGSSGAGSGNASGGNATGGRGGSGGVPATGGASTGGMNAGGMSATGGMSAGGNPNGGGANAGGAGTGGGTGGIPNDPNWMPPDMSNAKIVAFYHVDQGAATSTNIQMTIVLKNQTDAAYDLTNVTVRYWMSSEPPPRPEQYYSSAGLRLTGAPTFVPNMAVSYLLLSFRAGGVVPAYVDQNTLEQSRIQIGVQAGSAGNTRFNQANDWSFDATASGSKANPKITVYDGDTLIWGCEPSHVCAVISDGGEGGAGGQGS